MNPLFSNINDFIQFKQKCVFCKSQLVPLLSVFEIPGFNYKIKNDKFIFDIKYTSANQNINAIGSLDVNTNELKFDIIPTEDNILYTDVIPIFERLKPHAQLCCNNKKCGMNYYCCSNPFICEQASSRWGGHYYNYSDYTRIKPFGIYYEACNIGKYWVQNDIIIRKTKIISTTNPSSDPIIISPINFESLGKDKLKTRVLTIITFG